MVMKNNESDEVNVNLRTMLSSQLNVNFQLLEEHLITAANSDFS